MVNKKRIKISKASVEAKKLKPKLNKTKKQQTQNSCTINIDIADLNSLVNDVVDVKAERKNGVAEQSGWSSTAAQRNKRTNIINPQIHYKLRGSKNKKTFSQPKKGNKLSKRKQNITNGETSSCSNGKKSQQENSNKTKITEAQQKYTKPSSQHMLLHNTRSKLGSFSFCQNHNDIPQQLYSDDESMCSINFRNTRSFAGENFSDGSSETTDSNLNAWCKGEFCENGYGSETDSQSDYDTNDYSSSLDEEYMDHFQFSDFSDNDSDYELPKYIPEDVIIHQGTANKRDFNLTDDVQFDSDVDEAQVIELEKQDIVKTITQPYAYNKEELQKLVYQPNKTSSQPTSESFVIGDDDCSVLELTNEINNRNSSHSENSEEKSSLHDDDDESYRCNKYLEEFQSDVIDGTQSCSDEGKHSVQMDCNNVEMITEHQPPSECLAENIDLNNKSSVLIADVFDYDESQMLSGSDGEVDLYENSNGSVQFETACETIANDLSINDVLVENAHQAKHNEIDEYYTEACQTMTNSSTKFFAGLLDNTVIAIVKKPFYIYGTFNLTLLSGAVEIYGHSPKPNVEIEIFSPRGYPMVKVASQPSNPSRNWQASLEPYKPYYSVQDYKEIKRAYKLGKDALVLLKANDSSKRIQQQFLKFMDQNIFPTLQSMNINRPLHNMEYKLNCIINTTASKENCLILPQLWQNFNINQQSKVVIAGGKSVGKSTLLRFLLNKYISVYPRILLIDLDIGQPEIFVPETISCTLLTKPLIGPGFLFNLQPDKAFAIGHVDILLCSPEYIQATQKLISYCLAEEGYKNIPWLVNTMGYNRGFGLELITTILQQVPITDLIQLQSNKDVNNFTEFLSPVVLNSMQRHMFLDFKDNVPDYRLHIWKSPILQESSYQKQWKMSAKDTRYAILLTRLAAAFINDEEWLTDCQPISASLDDVKFVKLLENRYENELVVKAAIAKMVYLCHYTDDNSIMECFGIGVVRSIDYNIRRVFLIPAMPFNQLKYVNCLALGDVCLPSTLYTTQGPNVKNAAPFVCDTLDGNASKAVQNFYRRPFSFPKNA